MDLTDTLIVTAYCEAGHVVIAVLCRVRFKMVTIVPGGDQSRHLRNLRPVLGMERTHARGIVALAGEAAQQHYSSHVQQHVEGNHADVLAVAFDLMSSAAVAEALVNLWYTQAMEMVKARWGAIERVAAELLARQTLSATDVRQLISLPSQSIEPIAKRAQAGW